MAEIVNLRRARKSKARDEKEKAAAANRVHYGTPKALRDVAAANTDKTAQKHELHRIDRKDES
jgi:hypothetical protein